MLIIAATALVFVCLRWLYSIGFDLLFGES